MKTIIAGGRNLKDEAMVLQAIDKSGFVISELVCGMAQGIDLIAKAWAQNLKIAITEFPADWKRYGRAAGPIRNQQMADYADALIAIWDGKSPGTKSMIRNAQIKGLNVYVHLASNEIKTNEIR